MPIEGRRRPAALPAALSGASFEPAPVSCGLEPPSAAEWQSLRQRMPEPWCFLASSWAQAWAESHLPRERWRPPCRYLMVRDRTGAVTGVAPLATMQFGPIRFCAGGGYFLPYRSLALDAMAMDASCDAIVGALAGYVRFRAGFRLGPLAAIDPMSGALAAALIAKRWGSA